MHLTYDIDEKDLLKGTRQKIITNALATFKVEDRDGELMLAIPEARYGDALFSFAQALLKITDVSYMDEISVPLCPKRFLSGEGFSIGMILVRIHKVMEV